MFGNRLKIQVGTPVVIEENPLGTGIFVAKLHYAMKTRMEQMERENAELSAKINALESRTLDLKSDQDAHILNMKKLYDEKSKLLDKK